MAVRVRCADAQAARPLLGLVGRLERRLVAGLPRDVEVVLAGTAEAASPPGPPRVVVGEGPTTAQVVLALERGALAWVGTLQVGRLADAVRVVAAGHLWVAPETATACLAALRLSGHGRPDLEAVLLLAARGWPWRSIAAQHGASPADLADDVAAACGFARGR